MSQLGATSWKTSLPLGGLLWAPPRTALMQCCSGLWEHVSHLHWDFLGDGSVFHLLFYSQHLAQCPATSPSAVNNQNSWQPSSVLGTWYLNLTKDRSEHYFCPHFPMRILGHREVKSLAQGHTASRWQSWASSQASWLQSPTLSLQAKELTEGLVLGAASGLSQEPPTTLQGDARPFYRWGFQAHRRKVHMPRAPRSHHRDRTDSV